MSRIRTPICNFFQSCLAHFSASAESSGFPGRRAFRSVRQERALSGRKSGYCGDVLIVNSPLSGTVVPLSAVPDPVFAEAMVGPGLALDPEISDGIVTVCAPVAGRVTHAMAHAVIIGSPGKPSILVHLGVETVSLKGAGFDTHVAVGDEVAVGDLLTTWRTGEAGDRSILVPVVALQREKITDCASGTIEPGDPLFSVP